MRRVACIALPEIRVEIAQERERVERQNAKGPSSPMGVLAPSRSSLLAVVVGRPGGAVKTERDVLGNTRLDVVSREARALGVRAGQTTAAARARCAELRVSVIAEEAVSAALVRVAEAVLAFGPSVAFDMAQDVVWVEVGGCAHLHGGERALVQKLDTCVHALGHVGRVTIADGPRIAAAVARFASARRRGPLVVPEGKGAAAMRVLPIAALALDDDVTDWLADLGLVSCGDLQTLPRRALGSRLGGRVLDVMQLLDGEDRAPLDAWHPSEVPEERIELEWGASSVEALAFVTKTLCDRLAARLGGRGEAAARIELVLTLDRALCKDVSHVSTLDLALSTPIAGAADLLAVVRARLERHVLAAPVLAATLRALELAARSGRTLDLLTPEPKADRVLPRLAAELAADLGEERVGTLTLVDTWVPYERTRLVPFGSAPCPAPRHTLVTSAIEPTRLVDPARVPPECFVEEELLARVEAVEWWRGGVARRDLVAAWISEEIAGLMWVDRREDCTWLLGWVD